ncbi:MAG: VWA domain-containing protein [Chloroflexi bacterium]|nr:VWA domain-containing protein [Chloroflexota bacterium]
MAASGTGAEMVIYRYSRWDATQELFPFHADELMGQLSDQLLAQGDLSAALRSLLQRGVTTPAGNHLSGLQDLLHQLRALRQQLLERYSFESVLSHLDAQLKEVVNKERSGIGKRLEEASSRLEQTPFQDDLSPEAGQQLLQMLADRAHRSYQFLDQLPDDVAGRLRQLQEYEFMDPEAMTQFQRLVQSLKQRVLEAHLRELSSQFPAPDPTQADALKEMLRGLNSLLEDRLNGRPASGFDAFVRKYGALFDGHSPSSVEELAERLRRASARLQSLLKTLEPEQRRQLKEAMDALFRDAELRNALARLAANLHAFRGVEALGQAYPFQGTEPVGLEEALGLMERLQQMDDAERQLRRAYQGGGVADVDGRRLRDVLGEEAVHHLNVLRSLPERLEEAGYIRKVTDRYELTPRGMRRIGQKALQELFALIRKDRFGGHPVPVRGTSGERWDEETKRYDFGDAFEPHLSRTLLNAVERGEGVPFHLKAEDFEVYQRRLASPASTVLMVDLSLSMAMRGNFLAAKKVALALHSLIHSHFPRDLLYVVGFSTYAREVKGEQLPYLTWDELDPYTNIQHGLALARKLLSRQAVGTRQVIMVSDGEPTAHLEAGQLFLQYPPSPRTIRETLREVKRCTSQGIVINTFMLDRRSSLVDFVDQMTRINRGRVFYTTPERLGQYVLVDYFASRRRVLA